MIDINTFVAYFNINTGIYNIKKKYTDIRDMLNKKIYKIQTNPGKWYYFNISGIKYFLEHFFAMKLKNSMKFLVVLSLFIVSCSQVSPTVNPSDIISSYFSTPPGTVLMQSTYNYPANADTGIPLNANIVLVFSKNVNSGTVAANIQINAGAKTYASSVSNNIVTLTPTGGLTYGASYTVAVATGLQASDGQSLSAALNFTFTAVTTNSPVAPVVLTGTRNPVNGATGVSRSLSYVEVTFSKPVTNVTTTTFTIVPAVAGCTVTNPSGNTWRLNFGAALAYSPPNYTVSLSNLIIDTALPTANAITAHSWNFTTDVNPGTGNPSSISNVAVLSVTNTTAVIAFNTNRPAVRANTYLQYGITPALGTDSAHENTWDWDTCGQASHTDHGFNLNPPLVHNTLYYFRACVDVAGTCDVASPVYSFFTRTDTAAGGGGKVLSNANNNQLSIKIVQIDDGSSYVFWNDNNANIKGQFFNNAGAQQWAANGVTVNSASNVTQIEGIKVWNNAAGAISYQTVIVYKDSSDNLYAKRIYNTGATFANNAGWVGGEKDLTTTVKTGSTYSLARVHLQPTVQTAGTATIPGGGSLADLLFDKDVDFSAIGFLDNQDRVFTNTTPAANTNWYEYNILDQALSPYDIYKNVLRTDRSSFPTIPVQINLGSTIYYIGDFQTRTPYIIPQAGTTTSIACGTAGSLAGVAIGNIFRARFGSAIGVAPFTYNWGIVSSAPSGDCVNIDRVIPGFLFGSTADFLIYINTLGPYTSEAMTNPLWDGAATFTSSVLFGDVVINRNNFTAKATKALVSNVISDTSLELDTNIMSNGNGYSITRLPAGATYKTCGYSTSVPANYTLDDTHAAFIADSVNIGDLVYNLTTNLSAEVLAVNSATQITLSADIFNAVDNIYVIYTGTRAFMVTYVDTSDHISGKVFNLDTGVQIGGTISIAAVNTYTNPLSISDESGNALVFYYNNTSTRIDAASIPAKSISPANWTVTNIAPATYHPIQILKDSSINTVGGAYLISDNLNGAVDLYRISGTSGGTVFGPISLAGYSPHAAVDKYDITLPSRIILTYLPTHVAGNTYRHVGVAAYTGAGAVSIAAANITSNAVTTTYNCQLPRVVVSDTDPLAQNEFYIAWYDGRYFTSLGYSLYAQRFLSTGVKYSTAPWSNVIGSELYIASPSSYGIVLDSITGLPQLSLDLLYYDGGAIPPFGFIPIWLDYRNRAVTAVDLYYGLVKEDGTLP